MHLLHRMGAHIPFISAIIMVSFFCVGADTFAWKGALVDAAAEGNIDEVKRLLASDKVGSDELANALGIAANRAHIEVMKLLLDIGANPNQACTQFQKETPLVMAVTSAEAVKLLLNHGAVPAPKVWEESILFRQFDSAKLVLDESVERPEDPEDEEDENYMGHALIRHASNGDTEQVRRILKRGVGKNFSEDDLKMAFNKALAEGHADVLRVLLDAGIDPKKMGVPGGCALMEACQKGRIDIVKLLLDKGASANDGSALAAAAGGSYLPGHGGGHLDIVKLLVERGADVNAESDDCLDPSTDFTVTALQVEAREGHLEVVRYLLEKGADPKAEMSYAGNPGAGGNSAVAFAARNGHTEIVKLFLEKGEDVNRPTSGGITALMAASSRDELETAQFLLGRGANVNAADKEGDTPLFYALPNAALVKLLVEKGADPNIKNEEGLTVLEIAESQNLPEIVAILRASRPKEVPKREAK